VGHFGIFGVPIDGAAEVVELGEGGTTIEARKEIATAAKRMR